ncbi:uncharacterized protein LOC134825319 [Bolinopsis microptera]|uniref:uncharacterized protein LOC134825319 n=1 Tax=Bolinopsis microptera TaxID=2820187 RepID=UPI003078DC18
MKVMTLLALSCLALIKISNAGYAVADEYSKENCPICYNPRVNLPDDCTQDDADKTRTEACDEDELCYIMTLEEGAVPNAKSFNTNYHKGYNAQFLCADEIEFENIIKSIKIDGLTIRDVEVTTEPPTGSTTGTIEIVTEEPTETAQEITSCGAGKRPGAETGCEKCPENTYSVDGAACVECPGETPVTNVPRGATSAEQCFAGCAAGKFLDNKGKCEDCADNYYSTDAVHNTKCEECPAGSAKQPGSLPGNDCTTLSCEPGNFLLDAHTCSICPADTYSDQAHNEKCTACPGAGSSSSKCDIPEKTPEPTVPSSSAVVESCFLLLSFTLLIRL